MPRSGSDEKSGNQLGKSNSSITNRERHILAGKCQTRAKDKANSPKVGCLLGGADGNLIIHGCPVLSNERLVRRSYSTSNVMTLRKTLMMAADVN